MCAVRLGWYAIDAALAGTPSLVRLKSMMRYLRLAPPPRWREVMRPYALRPPLFVMPRTSDFSGSERVTSARSDQVAKRRPGLVGLCFLMAISRAPDPRTAQCCRPDAAARSPSSTLAYDRPSSHDAWAWT